MLSIKRATFSAGTCVEIVEIWYSSSACWVARAVCARALPYINRNSGPTRYAGSHETWWLPQCNDVQLRYTHWNNKLTLIETTSSVFLAKLISHQIITLRPPKRTISCRQTSANRSPRCLQKGLEIRFTW